jgi:hypothetical protein
MRSVSRDPAGRKAGSVSARKRRVIGCPLVDQLTVVHSDEPDPIYRYSYTRTRYPERRRAKVILYNPVHKGDVRDPTTGRCMTWLCA